jgi:hypothetical protein
VRSNYTRKHWVPFSSPSTTRRATVELFDPASTRLSVSESESHITTDGQSASPSWNKAPIWGLRLGFYYCQTVAGVLMWGAVSDERMGLSFTIAPGPRQRSHFQVPVPLGLVNHILLSQIQDFPFRRLLPLAGLRWRYSNPPPHDCPVTTHLLYDTTRTAYKTPLPTVLLLLIVYSLPGESVHRTFAY